MFELELEGLATLKIAEKTKTKSAREFHLGR
jgi:hypothetical protein